jgi:hypothetical protein
MSTAKLIFACAFAIAVVTSSAYAQNVPKNFSADTKTPAPPTGKLGNGKSDVMQGNRLITTGEKDEKSKNAAIQKLGQQDVTKGKADVTAGEKLGAKDPTESKLLSAGGPKKP